MDGINFTRVGQVQALNLTSGSVYSFDHTPVQQRQAFYRLRIVDLDGRFEYSQVLNVTPDIKSRNFVYPSIITTGVINIFTGESWQMAEVLNSHGAVIRKQVINGQTGRIDIPVNSVAAGIYFVRLRSNERTITQKVTIR